VIINNEELATVILRLRSTARWLEKLARDLQQSEPYVEQRGPGPEEDA
jgi:hypothetical protein